MTANDRPLVIAASLVVALAVFAAGAAGQDATVSAGISVRAVTGTFGTDQTSRLVYSPAMLGVDVGRFELAGFFPFVSLDSGTVTRNEGGFIPMSRVFSASTGGATSSPAGMGMHMRGGMGSASAGTAAAGSLIAPAAWQSGLGDIVASVGYRAVDRGILGLQVVVNGRAKLPTAAASRGIGTGRADYGVSGVVRRQFTAGWLYGEAGWIVLGDPDGVDLRNAVLWSAGGGRRVTSRLYLLASAYGNSAILPGFGAPFEVESGVGVRFSDHLSVSIMPSAGLSDASPSYGVTLSLSTRFLQR
jgi:hypothetical protein